MLNCRVAGAIAPRILHFMSNPKPWHGHFAPWDQAACAPYADIIRRHPELRPYRHAMPAGTRLRYQLQQRYKQLLETATWGFTEKRARILGYEQSLTAAAEPVT
jgi:lipopolysaccharide biosynthesis glycosyltransferase